MRTSTPGWGACSGGGRGRLPDAFKSRRSHAGLKTWCKVGRCTYSEDTTCVQDARHERSILFTKVRMPGLGLQCWLNYASGASKPLRVLCGMFKVPLDSDTEIPIKCLPGKASAYLHAFYASEQWEVSMHVGGGCTALCGDSGGVKEYFLTRDDEGVDSGVSHVQLPCWYITRLIGAKHIWIDVLI